MSSLREAFASAGGHQHVAAFLGEQVAQRLADAEIVVDHEDAHAGQLRVARAVAARSRRRAGGAGGRRRGRSSRVPGRYSRVAYSVPCAQVVQLGHDVLDAADRAVGRVEALALDDEVLVRADARDVLLDEVQVVDDDLERVVDLVRDADGDLAERRPADRGGGSRAGPWRSRSSRARRRSSVWMTEPEMATGRIAPLFGRRTWSRSCAPCPVHRRRSPSRMAVITLRASARSGYRRVTCWPSTSSGE